MVNMDTVRSVRDLGTFGKGLIAAKPDQQERLNECIDRLAAGAFHAATTATIPPCCTDGRLAVAPRLLPSTAAGTQTFTVADDLTARRFFAVTDDFTVAHETIVNIVTAGGEIAGAHIGTYASAANNKADCHALDQLEEVYAFITNINRRLRELAIEIGITPTNTQHETITSRASERAEFPGPLDVVKAVARTAGTSAIDQLQGEHKEVAVIINLRQGTTLDRQKLYAEFGAEYQAFNIDMWTFPQAATLLAEDINQKQDMIVAMAYYNLASVGLVCAPTMQLITLR